MQQEQMAAQGGGEEGGAPPGEGAPGGGGMPLQLSLASKPWTQQLAEMGFPFPIIKSVQPDGTKVWFQHGVTDYTATLNMGQLGQVEKAVMKAFVPPEIETTPTTPSDPVQRIDDADE